MDNIESVGRRKLRIFNFDMKTISYPYPNVDVECWTLEFEDNEHPASLKLRRDKTNFELGNYRRS